jgi:hypothetical protein
MKQSRLLGFRLVCVVGVLGGVVPWALTVSAEDEPDAASVAAARSLAIDGVKLAESGDCAGAVVKLTQAENLYHSQVVASRLGECEIQQGKIVEGSERLRRLLREPVPEHATPAVLSAIARAKEVLEQSAGKVASLHVDVSGPELSKTTVKINGNVVPAAGLGVEFPVNPGGAEIEVSAEGYFTQTEQVLLTAGEKLEVSMTLKPEPPKPAIEVAPVASEPAVLVGPVQNTSVGSAATVEERQAPSYAPAYVSYVVGALGLGVGAYYGLSAMSDYDTLKSKCTNNICPAGESDTLESAKTKGTIATVGFGVGAGAIVLGTILLLTSGSDDEPATAQYGITPWVDANRAGVWGRF